MIKGLIREILLDVGLYYRLKGLYAHTSQVRRDKHQRQFYSSIIGGGDLVFDIGANIGQRSNIFADLGARVVAVEPQPNCVRHLRSRFKYNSGVVVEHLGVGATEGEALLYQCPVDVLSSMSIEHIEKLGQSRFKGIEWNETVTVNLVTLDQLIDKHGLPKFLKIDVEGYELPVLSGLTRIVPYISFEYIPEMIEQAERCVRRINRISSAYYYNYCKEETLDFCLPEHLPCQMFLEEILPALRRGEWGDIYAVHRDAA